MPPVSPDQLIQSAVQFHQAGQMPQAERLYRQALAIQPNHPEALHLLGTLAVQVGQFQAGVELIQRAVSIRPEAHYYGNLGEAYRRLGKSDAAIDCFRKSLAIQPDFAAAHNNLGLTLNEKKEFEQAIVSFNRAIELKPDYAEAYTNMGNALADLDRYDEAVVAHNKAVSLNPGFAGAYSNQGVALSHLKRVDEAVVALNTAVRLDPKLANAHNNLGSVLADKGNYEAAEQALRRAITLQPDYSQAYSSLGNVLRELGRLDEALQACRKALELEPDNADAHCNLASVNSGARDLDAAVAGYYRAAALKPKLDSPYSNLGNVLRQQAKYAEAEAVCRKAIEINPDGHAARANLALVLLLRGEFESGWNEYESRLKVLKNPDRVFTQPQWDGGDLHGKTVLLHGEQGFGDTLMFARYVPLVSARGATVILEVQKELHRLLQGFSGAQNVLAKGASLPAFDLQCPLPSLPLAFATRVDSIPPVVPLSAPPDLVQTWKMKLSQNDHLHVGLVWAGQPKHANDRNRSIRLSQLGVLAKTPGVEFFSLQKGPAAAQAATPPGGMELIDWTAELHDFTDTAALISNLDLVISVDTAVVHLAATMGKAVWVLLPYSPDWRWLLDGDATPWYPSVRLFRQNSFGNWDEVIERVALALTELAQKR